MSRRWSPNFRTAFKASFAGFFAVRTPRAGGFEAAKRPCGSVVGFAAGSRFCAARGGPHGRRLGLRIGRLCGRRLRLGRGYWDGRFLRERFGSDKWRRQGSLLRHRDLSAQQFRPREAGSRRQLFGPWGGLLSFKERLLRRGSLLS